MELTSLPGSDLLIYCSIMKRLLALLISTGGFAVFLSCGEGDGGELPDKVYEAKYFVDNISGSDAVFIGKRRSANDSSKIVEIDISVPEASIVEVDSGLYSTGHVFPSNIYLSYSISMSGSELVLNDDDWHYCDPDKVEDEEQILEICHTLTTN